MFWIWCPSPAVWYAMDLFTVWICNDLLGGLKMQWPSLQFEYDVHLGGFDMMPFSKSLNTNAPIVILICNWPFGNLNMNGPLGNLNMNVPFGGSNMMALSAIWIWSALLAVLIWMSLLAVWIWFSSRQLNYEMALSVVWIWDEPLLNLNIIGPLGRLNMNDLLGGLNSFRFILSS